MTTPELCALAGCPNVADGGWVAFMATDPMDHLPREYIVRVCAEHTHAISAPIVGAVSSGQQR